MNDKKIQNSSISGMRLPEGVSMEQHLEACKQRAAAAGIGGHVDPNDYKTEVVYPVDRQLGEEHGFKLTDQHGARGTVCEVYPEGIVGLADALDDGSAESRSASKSLMSKLPAWKLTDMHGGRGVICEVHPEDTPHESRSGRKALMDRYFERLGALQDRGVLKAQCRHHRTSMQRYSSTIQLIQVKAIVGGEMLAVINPKAGYQMIKTYDLAGQPYHLLGNVPC